MAAAERVDLAKLFRLLHVGGVAGLFASRDDIAARRQQLLKLRVHSIEIGPGRVKDHVRPGVCHQLVYRAGHPGVAGCPWDDLTQRSPPESGSHVYRAHQPERRLAH